ncbi:MAG: GntR family transcriptional regulator [Streptosporangiales bacterium]|nr:GntR family transcriptional regulator [Streptosporangiales bacterium]
MGSEVAYQALRSAIVEGRIRPGDRIVEQRVAAQLDLSRTPVREAVRMLAADGLVLATRHRGAIVRTLGRNDVLDLYDLWARLESYAAELASTRATDDDLAEIDTGIRDFAAAAQRTDLSQLDLTRLVSDANRRVHNAIIAASKHVRLAHILTSTVDAPLVFEALRAFRHSELERSNNFHKMIRNRIARGEPKRAAALMFEHIMLGRDQVLLSMAAAEEHE